MRCDAVYQLNAELVPCRRRFGHRRRHVGRLTTTAYNGLERPLWASIVTIRWTAWRAIDGA